MKEKNCAINKAEANEKEMHFHNKRKSNKFTFSSIRNFLFYFFVFLNFYLDSVEISGATHCACAQYAHMP